MFRAECSISRVVLVLACITSISCSDQAVGGNDLASSGSASGRQYVPPDYVFEPDFPHDVVTQQLGAIGLQPFVDNLAWDAFIAASWPVPETIVERGVPDRQNVIGGFRVGSGGEGGGTEMPTGPVVWETYKAASDIYLNPPVAPSSFDTAPIIPAACTAAAEGANVSPSQVNKVLDESLQAFTGAPLIDLNGNKVWYEERFNRVYFDFVVDNQYYDSRNQPSQVIFPTSGNTTSQEPVVRVKAAWKILAGADDPSQFYSTYAYINDTSAGTCISQRVGLVGLHVVLKTETLQQWMWATFEHVQNAPDRDASDLDESYSFYNTQCGSNCPSSNDPTTSPTQVVREVPVNSTAPNGRFQSGLADLRADNVWKNYMLVDAQWGGSTDPGIPNQPSFLANTALETYLQDPVEVTGSPHGCINCHGTYASQKDTDFQLSGAYPRSADVTTLLAKFMR